MVTTDEAATPNYKDDTTGSDQDKALARRHNRMTDLKHVEGLKESSKKKSILENNIESAYSLV